MRLMAGLCCGLVFGAMNGYGQSPAEEKAPAAPVVTSAPVAPVAGPQSTPSQSPQQAAAVQGADRYVLGTDDAIQVTVWKEPTMSGPLLVRPDGRISVPLLGDVQASGLTPMELSKQIEEKLKKFMTDPTVTVTVTGANSQRIYFIGEVQRPGAVSLSPGMTLLQAISSVGGLTAYANAKHIYVLRGPAGKQQKIPFDYKKALKQGVQQGIVLAAGDTIVVP